jgi:hypothetical protein
MEMASKEATVNQAVEERQAGSERVSHEHTLDDNVIFGNEDAWDFLRHLRVAQDLYYKECKRSQGL